VVHDRLLRRIAQSHLLGNIVGEMEKAGQRAGIFLKGVMAVDPVHDFRAHV
jgi:hypothetical protein